MVQAIILAAGDIRNKLPFLEARSTCPALLPLNTKPILHYIIDFYKDKVDSLNVVVSEEHKKELESEINPEVFNYNLLTVPKTRGVVETLKLSCNKLQKDENLIVNLVTTIPTRFPENNEVQISNELTPYPVGSTISISENETKFISKKDKFVESGYPFTGVFRCEMKNLNSAIDKTDTFEDLLNVVEKLHQIEKLKFEPIDWVDCGHEINYFSAKSKLLSSRAFNNMDISTKDGILFKNSEDHEKLKKEHRFISMLPEDIKVFFPRLINDFKVKEGKGSYKMEYYGYPNIAEYLLYWQLSEGHWYRIFSRFDHILRKFQEHKFSIGPKSFQEFYYNKNTQRVHKFVEQLKKSNANYDWVNKQLKINNTICKPFAEIENQVKEKIKKLYNEEDFCIMHGDFCFNNILYDIPSGVVRLIDPRGSFSEKNVGIYGDQKYDLAKLTHSAIGCYDYIVNDLFELNHMTENEIRYNFKLRQNYDLVSYLCKKTIEDLGYDMKDIYFIMGLLFISMCPLHYDSFERQKLMYLHGLKILNEALEGKNEVMY